MIIFKTMVLVQTQLTKELHSEFVWSATRGEDTASKIYSERASKREREREISQHNHDQSVHFQDISFHGRHTVYS